MIDKNQRSINSLYEMKNLSSSKEQAAYLEKEISDLKSKKDEIDTSEFAELENQLEGIDRQLKGLEEQISQADRESGRLEQSLKNICLKIEEILVKLENSKNEYNAFLESHSVLRNEFENYYRSRKDD
jgi:chromosome segregation ATPase